MNRRRTIYFAAGGLLLALLAWMLLRPAALSLEAGVAPAQSIDSTDVQVMDLSHAVDGLAYSSTGEELFVLAKSREGEKSRHVIRCEVSSLQSTEFFSTFETLQGIAVSDDDAFMWTAQWRTGPNREAELLQIDASSGGVHRSLPFASLDGFGFRITSDPTAVELSPDGNLIAVGTKLVNDDDFAGGHIGGEVCVWDAETGELLWNNRTVHTAIPRSVTFSKHGKQLYSSGDDSMIRVWNARTGELQSTLVGTLYDGVATMEISPDGRYLASGGQGREEGGKVRVWDLKQQKFVHLFQPFQRESSVHVTFCSDGTLVAAGLDRESDPKAPKFEMRAWRAADFSSLGTIGNGDGWTRALVSSPHGSEVAIGTWEGQVLVYTFAVD